MRYKFQLKTTTYGTKVSSKGVNKGAPVGTDLKDQVTTNAETITKEVEGSKETNTEELIQNDPESKKAYEEISNEINKENDEKKEEEIREQQPGATTEVINNIGVTKDKNTNSNDNVVPTEETTPEKIVLDDGKNTIVDTTKVVDVPSAEIKPEEKAPAVEEKEDNKSEENKSTGIQSMFPEEDDNEEDSKEFSKQDELKAVEEDKKATEEKTEAPLIEEISAEVTEESTPEVKVVEDKKTTKEAKAELVETKKEVKQQNKVTEEKVEEVKEKNAQFVDTVIAVDRSQSATFRVSEGKIASVQNNDEQISVSNTDTTVTVKNNFPEFDGTISFTVVDTTGTAQTLTIILK